MLFYTWYHLITFKNKNNLLVKGLEGVVVVVNDERIDAFSRILKISLVTLIDKIKLLKS